MVLSALEMRLAGQGVEIPKYVVEHLGEADTDLVDMYHHPTVFNPHDLLSDVLVQIARDSKRQRLFEELFNPDGDEFHLRTLDHYLATGEAEVSFDMLSRRARTLGEIAIGYHCGESGVLQLVPQNHDELLPRSKYADLIVLAPN